MSVLNWGEVFYILWQRRGEEKARQTMANLSRLPIELVPVDLPQALKAAEIKAVHKIPYVDCVAAALAEIRQATLVTSDRDFEKLGRRLQILWLGRV
jgi:predicted nucleic acid-binding protein